jgi:LytS/YehU family sensor histidine kinase
MGFCFYDSLTRNMTFKLYMLLLAANAAGQKAGDVPATHDSYVKSIALFALLPIVIVFSFLVFIIYRKKREAHFRQTEAELNLKVAQEAIRAVKAQISPHFIFNCMNSIHHYMNRNDVKKAGDYLIKFSQLIRIVLENASQNNITIKEEVRSLELYIQLEQMRLNHAFTYDIRVTGDISDDAEIPNFMIQPFVENAIWHGLTKLAEGKLLITLTPDNHRMECTIESIGTGVKPGLDNPGLETFVSKRSMGLSLIQERVELINKTNTEKAYFTLDDHSVPGTYHYRVHLSLPVYTDD